MGDAGGITMLLDSSIPLMVEESLVTVVWRNPAGLLSWRLVEDIDLLLQTPGRERITPAVSAPWHTHNQPA
jgi:hypothetical protein